MKKISILGLHLGYGGVEQAIANLSNMLCDDYEVELVVTYKVIEEIPYNINKNVKITYLTNLKPNREDFKECCKKKNIVGILKEGLKSLYILKKRTSEMKKYIKNSDANIIISSRILYTKLLNKYGKNDIIKIAQEHCHHNNNQKYIKQLKKACRNIDYLMPVSNELTEFYRERINKKLKCVFIPNALEYWPKEKSNLIEKNLISIGRLSPEKGFLDLIDIFELVHLKYPNWKLNIIGDGVQMNLIKQKIAEKELNDFVILHGFQNKEYIYKELFHNSIYVMCSYEESFGIVLLEAASFGLPLIAFSSAQGAHEIIDQDKNGYLIENRNFEKMAEQIGKLIKNKEKRILLGENAKKSVQQYSFEIVKEKWISFLKNV